ncbi:MAG: TrkH family potassium uptake protein [Euryarchaeota archaeon]|nr:TrkH family potassium uptake protein [Euryarchaeota archaeon]
MPSSSSPCLSWESATWEAYVHAVAGVATGGFSSRSASIGAFDSHAVTFVAMAAMFLGAVSFPLYFRSVRHGLRVLLRHHEFRFFLSVIGAAFLAIAVFLLVSGRPWDFALREGLFLVVSTIATCGFNSADPNLFPEGAKLILIFLMFTGAMVGSTTGAIKLSRIELLLKLTFYEVTRLLHPRAVSVVKFGGGILTEQTMRRVIVFFFAYLTVFIGGALALSFFGWDLESSIVGSAATLGGVGYGWGTAGAGFADGDALGIRMVGNVLMWMGRLEIFTALILFVPATYRD